MTRRLCPRPHASQILASWKRLFPILKKTSAWLHLLRIAAAGSEGITLQQLRENTWSSSRLDRATLKGWEKGGVISSETSGPTHGVTAANHIRYFITPAGHRALLTRPEPETAAQTQHDLTQAAA